MTKKLKISDIEFDKEVYPRTGVDFITVSRYYNALKSGAKFPPIVVAELDGKNVLLDGAHRLAAHKSAKRKDIEVDLVKVEDRQELYIEAIKANVRHGKQFSTYDTTKICIKLKEFKFTDAKISELVLIPSDKISSFVAKRAALITQTGSSIAVKPELRHLAGTSQDASFEVEQGDLSGSKQIHLLDTVITMLEHSWFDLTNQKIADRLTSISNLLNQVTIPVSTKKTKKRK